MSSIGISEGDWFLRAWNPLGTDIDCVLVGRSSYTGCFKVIAQLDHGHNDVSSLRDGGRQSESDFLISASSRAEPCFLHVHVASVCIRNFVLVSDIPYRVYYLNGARSLQDR